jgi:hypothetical protein
VQASRLLTRKKPQSSKSQRDNFQKASGTISEKPAGQFPKSQQDNFQKASGTLVKHHPL